MPSYSDINLEDLSNLKQTCHSESKGPGYLVLSTLRDVAGQKGKPEWVVAVGTTRKGQDVSVEDVWWQAVYSYDEAKEAMQIDGSTISAKAMPSRIRESFSEGELRIEDSASRSNPDASIKLNIKMVTPVYQLTIPVSVSRTVDVDLEPCDSPPRPFSFVSYGLDVATDYKARIEDLQANLDQVRRELKEVKGSSSTAQSAPTAQSEGTNKSNGSSQSRKEPESPRKRKLGGAVGRHRGVVQGMKVDKKDEEFQSDDDSD